MVSASTLPGRQFVVGLDTHVGIDFVGDNRASRTEGVEALGAGPLTVGLLQIARRDVVDDGVTADVLAHVFIVADLRASLADDDG